MIELRGDELDAPLCPLSHVTARMEIVELMRHLLHAHEIICHHLLRELPQMFLGRAGIHRIRRMGHDGTERVRLHKTAQARRIRQVNRLRPATARIAREECKCRSTQLHRRLPHRLIALRR